MRLLITGGAGCLSANIINALPDAEILVIDNFATGSREAVTGYDNVCLVEGSVADNALMDKTFADFAPTHVIHAAASYKNPDDWQEDISTNMAGTANVVKLCQNADVKRLVYFQTVLCYGVPRQTPIPETHPLAPITSYSITKTAAERMLPLGRTPWVSLRLASVVAPGLAIGPIPTFYKRIKENRACFCSNAERDFLDFDDFMRFMRLCLEEGAPTGIYNVSSGRGHSMRQIYDQVAEYLGHDGPKPPTVPCGADDIPVVVPDPALASSAFGWQPQVSFQAMMAKILQWYDARGVGAIFSHLKHEQANA